MSGMIRGLMTTVLRVVPVALVLCILVLIGCDSSRWTTKSEWYAPAPSDRDWTPLPASSYRPVQNVPVAIALLTEHALVPLERSQLAALGIEPNTMPPEDLYLSRAVCLGCTDTGFIVSTANDGRFLLVEHAELGAKAEQMRKHAVVVALERRPEQAFAVCSMDE